MAPSANERRNETVRRGLGHVANLWQHSWEASCRLTNEETIQKVHCAVFKASIYGFSRLFQCLSEVL